MQYQHLTKLIGKAFLLCTLITLPHCVREHRPVAVDHQGCPQTADVVLFENRIYAEGLNFQDLALGKVDLTSKPELKKALSDTLGQAVTIEGLVCRATEKEKLNKEEAQALRTFLWDRVKGRDHLKMDATDLRPRHDSVIAAMANGNYAKAEDLNVKILAAHPASPRANYNMACIYSRLASNQPIQREKYLDKAEYYLDESLNLGIVHFLKLFANEARPVDKMENDPDLRAVLTKRRGAKKLLEQYRIEDTAVVPRPGGCIDSNMRVDLSNGDHQLIERIAVGDCLRAFDFHANKTSTACVTGVNQSFANRLVILNGHVKMTPSQPVLTALGWSAAGDIGKGTIVRISNGQDQEVQSVELVKGKFKVIDLLLDDPHTFLVEGLVVHNKTATHPGP